MSKNCCCAKCGKFYGEDLSAAIMCCISDSLDCRISEVEIKPLTSTEIRCETTFLYEKIKRCQDDLDLLRSKCSHTATHLAEYQWSSGHVGLSVVCDYCDCFVRCATLEEMEVFYDSSFGCPFDRYKN